MSLWNCEFFTGSTWSIVHETFGYGELRTLSALDGVLVAQFLTVDALDCRRSHGKCGDFLST